MVLARMLRTDILSALNIAPHHVLTQLSHKLAEVNICGEAAETWRSSLVISGFVRQETRLYLEKDLRGSDLFLAWHQQI